MRAARLEIALTDLYHADSLKAHERDSLQAANAILKDSAAVLAMRYRALRRFVPAAQDSIAKLLARLPDTTRDALAPAIAILRESGEACAASLTNCEQRAANAEQRAILDSGRVVALAGLNHDLEVAWRRAARAARPSLLRDFWRSRRLTGPLVILSAVLILKR